MTTLHEKGTASAMIPADPSQETHTFTLVFKGGAMVVLRVHGAKSVDDARAFACGILPNCSYEVRDGDEKLGHTQAFHAWTRKEAQMQYQRERSRHQRPPSPNSIVQSAPQGWGERQ